MTAIKSNFDIQNYIVKLLWNEPFYSVISRYIEKRKNWNIPTICVSVSDEGDFILNYNPNYMETLTQKQLSGVLEHEFQHIVLGHITTRWPNKNDIKFWNIATDLAVNSLLGKEKLPPQSLYPGVAPFEYMKECQAAETYLAILKKKYNNLKKQKVEQSSDHSGWISQGNNNKKNTSGKDSNNNSNSEQGSGGDSQEEKVKYEIADEKIKHIMRKAVQVCNTQGWGSISSSMRKQIMKRIKTIVDWRKVLQFFVKTSQKSEKRNSVRVVNRRFPYIHPGKKILRHAKIAIGIDQSGSVSDSFLSVFFSELEKLAFIAEFTVFFFDTEVDEESVFVWKRNQKINKLERTKCGGTCFTAPTEWVNKRNFDGFIIMTDMGAPKPIPCRCKRLWATTKECVEGGWGHKPKYEKVIFVEKPKDEY